MRIGWQRKVSLLLTLCLMFGFTSSYSFEKAFASDEFDSLREKWKEMITGGSLYNEADPDIAAKIQEIETTAQAYWNTLDTSSSRTRLWSNLGSNSNDVKLTYRRIKDMALAYSVKGSALENNAQLRDDIVSAMDWMYTHRYNESTANSYNWWDWEIGSPLEINDIVVMMYDDFTTAQRTNYMNAVERFSPVVNRTGANRVWKVTVVLVRGMIVEDDAKLIAARDGLSNVFAYSNSGDGFYLDGSFIQHSSHPYAGGYGKNLLADIANVMYLLEGSTWTVTNPARANVVEWIYNSFEPFMYEGAMMDMVRGREISRNAFQDHVTGHYVMQAILRVSQFAASVDAAAMQAMIKYWITADTYRSFYADASINMIVLAKQIMNNAAILPRSSYILHKQFPQMDRAVHHRPGFAFGISMHSTRISNYESINSENKRAWHMADGMTYLYNADLAHYSDDFWPTVNPYRLAGTTVLQNTTVNGGRGGSNAVGGAALEQYGVLGMHLKPLGQSLDAKKSWFLFDNEVVALGADISASEGLPVESIVENRKLNEAGNNTFTVNGTSKSSMLGWSEEMSGVQWAHLQGNVAGSGIGYYFPGGAAVHAQREARTGKWSDLNTYGTFGSTTPITRNYLNLWFDHGTDPLTASYAYVVLPNTTSTQVGNYTNNPDIVILENSGDAQGVKETTLGLKGIQYWKNQSKTVDGVTSDKISSVMVKETADTITVSAADPTQANTGVINLALNQSASCIVTSDATITVQQLSPTIQLSVDVNNAKGKSHVATFNKSGTCGATTQTYLFEAEDLSFTSSGDTTTVYSTDSQASGGQWRIYNSNAIGDYIEYAVNVPEAGTYAVSVRGKHYNDRGIAQLSVQGTNIGSAFDFYQSSASFVSTPVGTLSFTSGGTKSFRFAVTGKHAFSSGYKLPLDAIILERIGAAPATMLHEAELLTIAVSTGDAYNLHNDGQATNGKFTKLTANAVNDFISYVVPVTEPGTYRIEVRGKRFTDRGRYQLTIDEISQGNIQDQYASSEGYTTTDLGVVNFTQAGNKLFKFTVTGTFGSGYNLAFDHIRLVAE